MPITPPQYHERKLWQQNAFCEARGAPKQPFFAAEKWLDSRFAEVENGWIWLEPTVNETVIPTLVDSAGDSNSFFFDSSATEQYAAYGALCAPICSHIFRSWYCGGAAGTFRLCRPVSPL